MLNDVNKVLHQHLTNLLTPMLREKQSIQQVLLNMPVVKKLQDEHLRAHQAVYALQAEARFILALGEAPKEIMSFKFSRPYSSGFLVANTISIIYCSIFSSI